MKLKVKIMNVQDAEMGLDNIRTTDLWINKNKISTMLHEDDEIVFSIDGHEYTTNYTETKKIWFIKQIEENESANNIRPSSGEGRV